MSFIKFLIQEIKQDVKSCFKTNKKEYIEKTIEELKNLDLPIKTMEIISKPTDGDVAVYRMLSGYHDGFGGKGSDKISDKEIMKMLSASYVKCYAEEMN